MLDHGFGDYSTVEKITANNALSATFAPKDAAEWEGLDMTLFESGHYDVPPFPLHLLPEEWRRWVKDTGDSVGAPVDYVMQGLLGTVAGVCGAGVEAEISPAWREPLVLWNAAVGMPSSGKSPALAAARRLLSPIEDAHRVADDERRRDHAVKVEQARIATDKWKAECETASKQGVPLPLKPVEADFDDAFSPTQIVVGDATIEAMADVIHGSERGVVLWRDELSAWLANLGRYASGGSDRAHWLEAWSAAGVTINRKSRKAPLYLKKFPVSVVGTIQPDRLADALAGGDDGMAARFLYACPHPPPYLSLHDRLQPFDQAAVDRLGKINAVAGSIADPLRLTFTPDSLVLFDDFSRRLHADCLEAEGLEAGWLGKGRGTVARLATALALLAWSEGCGLPQAVEVEALKNAAELWTDYYRPHAMAAISNAGRTDRDRHARKAARWLARSNPTEVSLRDIRRDALGGMLGKDDAQAVIDRLVIANVLCRLPSHGSSAGGPRVHRWKVNPALESIQKTQMS